MTNKEQIIIDGVDVKNCRRRIGKNNYCRYFKRLCSENNFNCVWKQLTRKTQECEQLKEKYEALKLENQEGYEIVDELKQECEELKEELKELKRQYKLSCLDCEYKNMKADVNRYRKALEEIEVAIETYSRKHQYSIANDLYNQILDIINKAKGEGDE